MAVSYKKDLRKNYMVINEVVWSKDNDCCAQMLIYNQIDGILPIEKRIIDNNVHLYYEITGKQSLNTLIERSVIGYDKIRNLYISILSILDKGREYLLNEDDFILSPECIYLDIITEQPYLCYQFGFNVSMKEQINMITEFLMNKVDYNDKEGVFLIYRLYAVGKEAGFTIGHLHEVLYHEKHRLEEVAIQEEEKLRKKSVERLREISIVQEHGKHEDNPNPLGNIISKQVKTTGIKEAINQKQIGQGYTKQMLLEKIEGEVEKDGYSLQTYVFTMLALLVGIAFLIYGLRSGIIYDSYGKRIEYGKLIAFIILLGSVEGYTMSKLWNKKNKITKIGRVEEYVYPQNLLEHKKRNEGNKAYEKDMKDMIHIPLQREQVELNRSLLTEKEEDWGEAPTCLLNGVKKERNMLLKSLGKEHKESILINKSIFFIGKLKKNVDYCIEHESVSRYHAKITYEEGEYYITDLNSMNGTFLNQQALGTYEKTKINYEDEIAFADFRYRFEQSS